MTETLVLLLIILTLAARRGRIPATLRRNFQYVCRAFFGAILRSLPAAELEYYQMIAKKMSDESQSANTPATVSAMSDAFPNKTILPALLGTASSCGNSGKDNSFRNVVDAESLLLRTLLEELRIKEIAVNSNLTKPMKVRDRRFWKDKKKYYRCDSCRNVVTYKGQAIPFQGNFLHQGPHAPKTLFEKEEAWRAGTWDATWLCVKCLSNHHGCSIDEASRLFIGNFSAERELTREKYLRPKP